jgi:hypothetical protein
MIISEIILSVILLSLLVVIAYQEHQKSKLLDKVKNLEKHINQEFNKNQMLTDKLCQTRKDLMICQGQKWLCELSKNKSND